MRLLPKQLILTLVFLPILVVSVIFIKQVTPQTATRAAAHTAIEILPTSIGPNDGYTLKITVDGVPYYGYLDYDLTMCPLNFDPVLNPCKNIQGQWGNFLVSNGTITIPGSYTLPLAYYLVRYKPRGKTTDYYSNFDLQIVSASSVVYKNVSFSGTQLPLPPRGAYSILENRDAYGNFKGYSRIDVETDTDTSFCPPGGYVWRYTKSNSSAYWNTGSPSVLRWCITESSTPNGLQVRAVSGKIYNFDFYNTLYPPGASGIINVQYSDSFPYDQSYQALLGGFTGATGSWDSNHNDGDMSYFYQLYPYNRILPANLSATPQPMINTALGHPLNGIDTNFDIWHVDMLAPSSVAPPNSLVTFRQVESGWKNRATQIMWSLTEDWTFSPQGLFNMIRQWWNPPTRCWDRTPPQCEAGNDSKNLTAKVVESFIPKTSPLYISLKVPGSAGTGSDNLTIHWGQPYELLVRQSNGIPYSGFLEIKTGTASLWRDINRRPIYVSHGSVIIPQAAYGNLGRTSTYSTTFSVRPFLTNSSLNSLIPTADWSNNGIISNYAGTLGIPFSSSVTQITHP